MHAESSSSTQSPVILVGSGAVGCTLAWYLTAAGIPCKWLARDKDQQKLSDTAQLQLLTPHGLLPPQPAPALATGLGPDPQTVVIAVKASGLPAAIARLNLTHPQGQGLRIYSCLNGTRAAPTLRQALPAADVVPLTIMFNAQWLAPLHAQITTKPDIVVGGQGRPDLLWLKTDLGVKRAHGDTASWGKLLINLGNALGALTLSTFKDLLTEPDLRRCYAAVIEEAVEVLRIAKVRYQLPLPLPAASYAQFLRYGGPIPWWFARARNGLADGAYPSMVADVRAGLPTEVQELNGAIVDLAQLNGIDAPRNKAIAKAVLSLSGPQRAPAYTRAELRAMLRA